MPRPAADMRICSLLPSATEIVYALGLGDRLVAVTHECDYPAETSRLPAITRSALDHASSTSRDIHNHVMASVHGGSSIYHLDQELLRRLDPDLILTQELCDVCAVSYEEVRRAVRVLPARSEAGEERRILSLEPTNLDGVLDSIRTVGSMTGVPDVAERVVDGLRRRIDAVAGRASAAEKRPRVFAMEWLDPLFAGGHWVPEMVRLAGGQDSLGQEGHHSETVDWERVTKYDPEVVVVMPCGYDLPRTMRELLRAPFPQDWRKLSAFRTGRVYAVDGSAYFNRPGPRLVDGLEILAEVLHPELFPRQKHTSQWQRVEDLP
jgi:iron complex transport system substrate-binding protein